MPGFGHLPEILLLLIVGLLVLGPKRMIEMGSSLGRAVRPFRESVKDIPGMSGGIPTLGSLLQDTEPRHTPFSTASQFAQNLNIERTNTDAPAASSASATAGPTAASDGAAPTVVEATVEHVEEHPEEE